jgi:hypothetical protein
VVSVACAGIGAACNRRAKANASTCKLRTDA